MLITRLIVRLDRGTFSSLSCFITRSLAAMQRPMAWNLGKRAAPFLRIAKLPRVITKSWMIHEYRRWRTRKRYAGWQHF